MKWNSERARHTSIDVCDGEPESGLQGQTAATNWKPLREDHSTREDLATRAMN